MMKRLLIVDDTLPNLKLLGSILKDQYSLSFASDGQEALDLLEKDIPDLILLDVMMPGIDGFEVCSRIRNNQRTSSVPIIFLSAKNDRESVIKGMGLGAQDYIVKPFEPEQVIRRIALQFPNKIIPQLSSQARSISQTNKIFLSNRMKNSHTAYEQNNAKYVDDLLSIEEKLDPLVSHIPNLLAYLQELEEYLIKLNKDDPKKNAKLSSIQEKRINPELTAAIHTLHDNFQDCQFNIIDLINDMSPTPANKLRNEIPSFKTLLTDQIALWGENVTLQWNINRDIPLPLQKDNMIQVLLSLLDNAFDAMESEDKPCTIRVEMKKLDLIISVEDSGPGIPLNALEDIWKSGFTSKDNRYGYGLTSVKSIVEEHFYGSVKIPYPDKGQIDIIIPLR